MASALKDGSHFIWALMRLDVHIMTVLFGQGVRPSGVVYRNPLNLIGGDAAGLTINQDLGCGVVPLTLLNCPTHVG